MIDEPVPTMAEMVPATSPTARTKRKLKSFSRKQYARDDIVAQGVPSFAMDGRHTPRTRSTQYAAASRFITDALEYWNARQAVR